MVSLPLKAIWVTQFHDALHVSTNTHLFVAYNYFSFYLHVLFQLVHDNKFENEKVLFGFFFSFHRASIHGQHHK